MVEPSMSSFAHRVQRMHRSVERVLANAMGAWNDGDPFGALLDQELEDGFMDGSVTAVRKTVSLCVVNTPGIAEGSSALRINGQPCRITGPVVPDAGGWATFPIVFTEGAHAGP